MSKLVDSGFRKEFDTGAIRDLPEGKGRCDLLPLGIIGKMTQDPILLSVELYIRHIEKYWLWVAIQKFADKYFEDIQTALLEAARQYEDGAIKYSERNWEKGMPVHIFIDSAIRHYLKFCRGDVDEPHDRAFVWNLLGALWTHENKPELIDMPGKENNYESSKI